MPKSRKVPLLLRSESKYHLHARKLSRAAGRAASELRHVINGTWPPLEHRMLTLPTHPGPLKAMLEVVAGLADCEITLSDAARQSATGSAFAWKLHRGDLSAAGGMIWCWTNSRLAPMRLRDVIRAAFIPDTTPKNDLVYLSLHGTYVDLWTPWFSERRVRRRLRKAARLLSETKWG